MNVSPPTGEPPAENHVHPAEWWLDAVKREERRGELLAAFDLAERGLDEYPDDLALKHRAVLALARAGATEEAARRFDEYALADIPDEDIAALRARIAKDIALAEGGATRRRRAARAAELYGAVAERTGGYYPAINAATLWLIAGDEERARGAARDVLELLARSNEDTYYAAATEGEAHLLLGDQPDAREALERAAERNDGDYGALATTRRQLRTICEVQGIDPALLSALAGPAVVHFCGHRIAGELGEGRFPPDAEERVARRFAEVVERHPTGFAYGSLASGADIMWAEALLAAGAELHVVLPFAREEFINLSVRPAGEAWVERFHRCLHAATVVDYATRDAFLGDDVLFRYCSELAMGLALLRGRYLDAEVRQLALWDGESADGAAGTAIDVATWRRGSRPLTIVSPDPDVPTVDEAGGVRVALATPQASGETDSGRVVRAMLFGDVKGFSKLTDEQLPMFSRLFLGAFAAAVNRHRGDVWHRNTWGDALYLVLSDATTAAAGALELQDALAGLDLAGEGLPTTLALRLGGHIGPVFPTYDPVLETQGFMGSHVSRTARIEPVTPPGAVYVTEPFAAALVLAERREFACDYVGHMKAAKDYGRLRMYRLRRAGVDAQPSGEAEQVASPGV
jgi:tetratricopeptide (TPR) repeat protein